MSSVSLTTTKKHTPPQVGHVHIAKPTINATHSQIIFMFYIFLFICQNMVSKYVIHISVMRLLKPQKSSMVFQTLCIFKPLVCVCLCVCVNMAISVYFETICVCVCIYINMAISLYFKTIFVYVCVCVNMAISVYFKTICVYVLTWPSLCLCFQSMVSFHLDQGQPLQGKHLYM